MVQATQGKNLFNEVKLYSEQIDSTRNGDVWKCKLVYKGKQYTFPFTKGIGHYGKEPDVKETMYCLISDAQTIEYCRNVQELMDAFGYDDYQQALKIMNACAKTAKALKRVFGSDIQWFIKALEN